jgi:hypothetical protein
LSIGIATGIVEFVPDCTGSPYGVWAPAAASRTVVGADAVTAPSARVPDVGLGAFRPTIID